MSALNPSMLGWSVSSVLGDYGPQAHHPAGKIALLWENGSRTYAELRDRALRLAGALRSMGLVQGDRVATLMFNRGETFELYFACAYAGLTLVPMSFRLTAPEVSSILGDCGARVIFTEPELIGLLTPDTVANLGARVVTLGTTDGGDAYEALATETPRLGAPVPSEIQLILYTSGSTGKPKGVIMRALSVMWCAMQQITQFRKFDADAVMLMSAPMFNTAGINEGCVPTFIVGGTVAIMPSKGWNAERFAELIDRWKVTHTLVFPSMFRAMIEADEKSPLPLGTMKWWYTGGENCPPALMSEIRHRWPGVHLMISYGSTESGLVTLIEDEEIERYPSSVGRIAPGQTIRLLDPEGRDVPTGEVGEVWTAGPAVTSNYWNAPDLDAENIRDGWLRIGDLARIDEEGRYYIVGRSKDLIISKSQNIYPAEIENVIRRHPAVRDVAVVGLPDAEFGEAVCAAIIERPGVSVTKEAILEFALVSLASYKKPRHILFLDHFPIRNQTKVDKAELAGICAAMVANSQERA